MPNTLLLSVVVAVLVCLMEPVECLEVDGSDQEDGSYTDEEILALCSLNPFLNICYEHTMDKRKSAYMRFGRSYPGFSDGELYPVEKRKSAYMRFGKREDGSSKDFVKRKSAYMRFGKRSPDYYENDVQDVGKRKSAYMRFGRR